MYNYRYKQVHIANLTILAAEFQGFQRKFVMSQRTAVHLTRILWREMQVNCETQAEKMRVIRKLSPSHHSLFKDTDICFCCFVTETRLFSDSWSGAVGICFSYGCPIYLQYGLSCFSMGYNTKSVTADIKETIENLNITRCRWKQ